MYRNVLLAYDGTAEGRSALREGALMAHRDGAKVFLLCVAAETPGVRIGEAAYPAGVSQTQGGYKGLFDEAMEKLSLLGVEASGRMVTGEPAEQIAAVAREIRADLVVVGHRRKGLIARWWAGSTGAYLSDHVGCSVLIAQNTVSDEAFKAEIASRTA